MAPMLRQSIDLSYLRSKAAKYRRLAEAINHSETAGQLLAMATQLEGQLHLAEAEARMLDGPRMRRERPSRKSE